MAVNSTFSFEELLEQANTFVYALKCNHALEKLDLSLERTDKPDYRYYFVRGKAMECLGYDSDAISLFKTSISLKPNQPELLLRMSVLQENYRKPLEALHYTKLYLTLNPDDRAERYRSVILAGKTGEIKYRDYSLQILKSANKYENDKNTIIKRLTDNISKRNYNQTIEDAKKFLPYFPDNREMNDLYLVALENAKPLELEKAYIAAAAIYQDEPTYFFKFGIYLSNNKKHKAALDAFRKALHISWFKNGKLEEDILFQLRLCYFNLGQWIDVKATDSLIQDLRNKNEISFQTIKSRIKLYPNSREYLIYMIWRMIRENQTSELDDFKYFLQQRDTKMENIELLHIISPFSDFTEYIYNK